MADAKVGGGISGNDSSSNGLVNENSVSTRHGTSSLLSQPLNSGDISSALDYSRGTFLGQGGDVANAQANLRTYGDRALGEVGAGTGYLNNTLSGNYLNSNPANAMLQPIANGSADGRWSNPFADAAFNQGASAIEGRMRGAFGNSDVHPGGGLQQAALGGALADLGTGIYLPTAQAERGYQMGAINQIGSNYAGERANQQGAASMIPGYSSAMLQPGQVQLAAAGAPVQSYVNTLGAVSPGTNISGTTDLTSSTTGTKSATGSSSGSSENLGGKIK